MKATQKLLQYQYPSFILRYPQLIRLVYVSNYITQLRKWYVMKVWRNVLKKAPSKFVAADFGSGECQYILPFCKKYSQASFLALDINAENVALANSFKQQNLKAQVVNLETNTTIFKANVGICIGVLHYIKDDITAIKNIYNSLQAKGILVLYVPIEGKMLTPFYKYFFNRYQQYESLNNRQRIYTEKEITTKLANAGFSIVEKKYAYGFWGKLSHELLNSCTIIYYSAVWPLKILALICLIVLLPFIYLCMFLDVVSNNTSGNGLLLHLQKD